MTLTTLNISLCTKCIILKLQSPLAYLLTLCAEKSRKEMRYRKDPKGIKHTY